MKSNEHRNLVVARVNSEFARHRSFSDLPVVASTSENNSVVIEDIVLESAYVDALFRLFDIDPTFSLLGREGNRVVAG
jgi:hypothetical protein